VESTAERECLWLVSNGVPFDVAYGVDDIRRVAMSIIFSEIQGSEKFDFNTMSFPKAD
jgi:hypothetical protein